MNVSFRTSTVKNKQNIRLKSLERPLSLDKLVLSQDLLDVVSLLRILDLVQVLLEVASVHLEAVELFDDGQEKDHDSLLVVLPHTVSDTDVDDLLGKLLLLVAEVFDLRGLSLGLLVQLDKLYQGLLFLVLSLFAFGFFLDELAHRGLKLSLERTLSILNIILDLSVVFYLSVVILEQLFVLLLFGPDFILVLPSDIDLLGVDLEI